MPAKNLKRIAQKGTYSHIYNKAVENRIIFNDEQDYEVFSGFLRDYLTPATERRNIKKTFTIKGQIYQGAPHQPKNYYNRVELLAYSLMPNHFHLILHQISDDSIQSFIRSLCTRYSMYFNRKYKRTGSLFEGPYKSVQIKDLTQLIYLTCFIHGSSKHSSLFEYFGEKVTSWVKPEVVISFLESAENNKYLAEKNYKKFAEKFSSNAQKGVLLEGIMLEKSTAHLEGRNLEVGSPRPPQLVFEKVNPVVSAGRPTSRSSIPAYISVFVVFFILLGLGIRNIKASESIESQVLSDETTVESSPTPAASQSPSPTSTPIIEEEKAKQIVVIEIKDGSQKVNIRSKPSASADKIGEALDGDFFDLVSLKPNWFELKLNDGLTGFVSSKYASLKDVTN